MDDPGVAWMERSGIRAACAGNPGLHPGYNHNKGLDLSKLTGQTTKYSHILFD